MSNYADRDPATLVYANEGAERMSEPRERPILFNGEMVRAILDGRKTQTRRAVKPQPVHGPDTWHGDMMECWTQGPCALCRTTGKDDDVEWSGPYGKPGDVLWVRETWAPVDELCSDPSDGAIYRATYSGRIQPERWRPSIHMPRSIARIFLRVTSVRVERIQEISEVDAQAEGVRGREGWDALDCTIGQPPVSARDAFRDLWDSINAGRGYGWDVNPWVWVIEFERINAAREAGMKEA